MFFRFIPSQFLSHSRVSFVLAFLEFLQTDAAWDVWAEFGYEKAEKKPEEKADDTKAEDGKAEGDKPADKPADKAEEKPAK